MREKEIANGYFVRDDGTIRTKTGKITRGTIGRTGYRNFTVYLGKHEKYATGRSCCKGVHQFVAQAFVHNPRPDIFNMVDHIDRNPQNNHYTNLRWVNLRLNAINNRKDCVSFFSGNRNRKKPWRARIRPTSKFFATREEAVEYAREYKIKRFNEVYKELLESEPRFKSVGVQTDVC